MAKPNKKETKRFFEELGLFTPIPHAVLQNERYIQTHSTACKLLWYIAMQFNRYKKNNGALYCTQSMVENYGFSNETRNRCLKILKDNELIIQTRQGGKNYPSLFAVSWLPINACEDKNLDVAETKKALIDFKGEAVQKKLNKNMRRIT